MNTTLLDIGRLTIGGGVKQAVRVSAALGHAKDMKGVRKAPVPGYKWSKPDEPTAVEGGDKFALFGPSESEQAVANQIKAREDAYAQQVSNSQEQYGQQVARWQDSMRKQRAGEVWDARKGVWSSQLGNAADTVKGVGRVATGFVRTPGAWLSGYVAGGRPGAQAAVADSRQETEKLLAGDPNRTMAAKMRLERAQQAAVAPLPAAPAAPQIQVPDNFKPVPNTAEAAREMYRPQPRYSTILGQNVGGEVIQKPKLGPGPGPAMPPPPEVPKLPAIPASLKPSISTPSQAIQAKAAPGGSMKPISLPAPTNKQSSMVKQANPLNGIIAAIKLTRAGRAVAPAVTGASNYLKAHGALAQGLKDSVGGVPGAAFGWYTTPYYQPDLNEGNMRTARTVNALFGYLMGRGGVRALGGGAKLPKGQGFVSGASGMLLTNPAINAVNQVEESFKTLPTSITETGKSIEQAQAGTGRKLLVAAGILAAGGLGATGYQAYRDRKQDTSRKGTIRVTLPTKRLGDAESTVDMPLNVLSNEAYKGIMRDTRRRVRGENTERIQHRGAAVAPMQMGAEMYDSFAEPA